jgi:PAS domain S-box-containing protein
VSIHNKALTAILSDPILQEPAVQATERASAFFAESLSPFEMVLRGFREANTSLRSSLDQIQTAQLELHRQNQELVTAQHSLESERQRYHELFNLAPDPYLVTDMEGTILEANNPAADLLQIPQELLVNQPLSVFVREEERESFRAQLERLRQGELEALESWPTTVQTHGGRSVSGSLTVGKARDSQGRLVGLRCLLRDTTERKRVEEERAQLSIREHLAGAEMAAAQRSYCLGETS